MYTLHLMPKTVLPATPAHNSTEYAVAERSKIRVHLPKALQTLVDLMDSENENVKLTAALKIIEHSIGRAPQSIEVDSTGGTIDGYAAAWRDMIASGQIDMKPHRVIEVVQVPGEAITVEAEVVDDDE